MNVSTWAMKNAAMLITYLFLIYLQTSTLYYGNEDMRGGAENWFGCQQLLVL